MGRPRTAIVKALALALLIRRPQDIDLGTGPMDIAQIISSVVTAWQTPSASDTTQELGDAPPESNVLRDLIATAFEASLLREENRPLTFRLILRGPEKFPDSTGPPEGLQRLPFEDLRPFTAQELRRLTPAVDHDRSLVGVSADENNRLQIWGIVHSGPRWLEQFYGGRGRTLDLPDSLILGVYDPGYMVISQGSRTLCTLEGGVLQINRLNVFDTKWFPEFFEEVRHELRQLHNVARASSRVRWATVDPEFIRMVGRQMIQRLISTVQRSRHGGTLLVVPIGRAEELTQANPWIKLKYKFVGDEPRSRFRRLIVRTMNALAASGDQLHDDDHTVGWREYGRAAGRELSDLDEAIFDLAHMIATLTAIDGAVVVTQRFELLGFGGEIAGSLSEIPSVARASDPEGATYCTESTEDVGTRHRSVYRFCNALPDVLGIIISQDGDARFVRWNDSRVMYWNHSPLTPP